MSDGDGAREAASEAEFDVMADWTADAVAALGPDHALPAACRGSGSPAALEWLAARCGLGPGVQLLDCGAGAGGAAAFAADRTGATPLLVEPMPGGCRAARRMFGLPVAAGTGDRLPIPSATFAAAWSLGVLSTTPAWEAVLHELGRVLRVDGSLGLLVLVRQTQDLPDAPADLDPPSRPALARALDDAGLRISEERGADELPSAPVGWERRAERVGRWVAERHRHDPRWREAQDNEDRIGRLLSDGRLATRLLHVRPT